MNQHEDTYIEFNPKIPRAYELRLWFDSLNYEARE